ncbi:LacI family DNA-binding transcriptional regulator [Limosilactobacillus fermentum]
MRRLTITDVAREAGVSTTTVSRYLNGHLPKNGEETKERVAKTIKRLNYAPSASAQKLRQNESHLVGVLVGEISTLLRRFPRGSTTFYRGPATISS